MIFFASTNMIIVYSKKVQTLIRIMRLHTITISFLAFSRASIASPAAVPKNGLDIMV